MSMTTARNLIKSFRPESYDVRLNIDSRSNTFKGEVRVKGLKTGPPSYRLTFNQHNLKISAATITRYNRQTEQPMKIIRINHHKSFDEVRLHSSEKLPNGSYGISMTFHGKLSNDLRASYPVFLAAGSQSATNSPQLENYLSGDVFPCIDEPGGAKASFNLTLAAF
jgi:aminopeptidase N